MPEALGAHFSSFDRQTIDWRIEWQTGGWGCLTDGPTVQLKADWHTDCLKIWQNDRLFYIPIGQFTDWLTDGLPDRLTDWHNHLQTERTTDRQANKFTYKWTTRLNQSPTHKITHHVKQYLNTLSVSVRAESCSIITVRQCVRFHPVICVVSSLGSNPFYSWRHSQVNLPPLVHVVVLSNPASPSLAVILCLEPSTPRTIVMVVHRGGNEHGPKDASILESERDVAAIYDKEERHE